jgi:hypothetical protein
MSKKLNFISLLNLVLLSAILIILVACNQQQANYDLKTVKFVPALPEVPLPETYEVDPTAGSFFDTAEGRIAETYAAGIEDLNEVVRFYKTVMPQLGWQEIEELVFYKEGEILILTPEEEEYINTIRYQLKPASTSRVDQ